MGKKDKNEILKNLPKVDELIKSMEEELRQAPRALIKAAVREEIDTMRQDILAGELTEPSPELLSARIRLKIAEKERYRLRGLINATGVVLHTNLGRACLTDEAVDQLTAVGRGYSNLEFNLETGERGERYDHVEKLICDLTGAEAAVVVNNNAAAVLVALNTIATGREVIVSRGELVEIGGSFRIPEVMEAGGCILREVGTTNKTRVSDYENAVREDTGCLLKVHTSNYKIIGFTQSAELHELYELGRKTELPVMYDLGCGLLSDLRGLGIGSEPTVGECVPHADVICFSGDKLLGGPQAGIIVGRREYVDAIKANQLLRALRVDKLTLSALEITLREYLMPEKALCKIPVLRMLTQDIHEIEDRARALIALMPPELGDCLEIRETESQVGGGTMPEVLLPSYAAAVTDARGISADELCRRLRLSEIPAVARINHDAVLLDMRTVSSAELPRLARSVAEALGTGASL